MAGDIRRIFDFGDIVLVHEAATTLYNEISTQQRQQKLGSVTSKNQHLVPSLSLLWEYFTSPHAATSRLCGRIAVEFANSNVLDRQYVLQQFLHLTPLTKCPNSVLDSLVDLLILLWRTDEKAMNSCRISERPLVQYYRCGKSTINEILRGCDRMRAAIWIESILWPALYLILATDVDSNHKKVILSWLRVQVANGVIEQSHLWNVYKFAAPAKDLDVLSFIVSMQQSGDPVDETLVVEVLNRIKSQVDSDEGNVAEDLQFVERSVKALSSESLELISLGLSSCFLQLPYETMGIALKIGLHVVHFSCPLYKSLLFASLVNLSSIVGQLKAIGSSNVDSAEILLTVQSCLTAINKETKERPTCSFHGKDVSTPRPKTLIGTLCQHPATVTPFLRALARLNYPANNTMLNLISSLLIVYGDDDEVCRQCCEIILKMVASEPEKVSIVLPVFVHVATRKLASDPDGALLDFVPKLAVHHLCTPKILRFLVGLAQNQKTRHHGYRLLGILFEKQPFVYRQVKGLFDDVASVNDDSLAMLKMEFLSVVCRVSGGDQCDELVPILTNVINKRCTVWSESTTKILTMTMAAIGELCRYESFDPVVMWRTLYGKLNKCGESALRVLCDFAGTFAEISDGPDSDPGSVEVFRFLWKLASDQKTSVDCRAAAFRALSQFDFSSVDKSQQSETSSEASEFQKLVFGGSVIALLDLVDNESSEELSKFLSKLITAEVDSIGRGTYYNAKLQSSRIVSTSLDEFCSTLNALCSQDGAFPTDKNLSVAMLLVYEPPADVSLRGGGVMKKSLLSAGRHYLHALQNLLVMVPFDGPSLWKRALVVPFGWMKFIGRMFPALMSSRVTEIELSIKGKESGASQQTAFLWARDTVADVLKSIWQQNVEARPTCCLALAALAVAAKEYQDAVNSHSCAAADTWTLMAVETLLGLASHDYVPKSKCLFFEQLGPSQNQSDKATSNAARLGSSFILPMFHDHISGGTCEQFGHRLLNDRPRDESEQDVSFYFWFSASIYAWESEKVGVAFCHLPQSESPEYQSFGQWILATVRAIAVQDFDEAESLLADMLDKLEKSTLEPSYRHATLYVIGITSLLIYSDHLSFIDSNLCQRLNELISLSEDTYGCGVPGFLLKFGERLWKENYRRSVTNSLKSLNDENSSRDEKSDAFQWLCSCCGSDRFITASLGLAKQLDNDDRSLLNELCRASKKMLSRLTAKEDVDGESNCILSLASVAFSINFASTHSLERSLPTDYSYLDESSILRHSVAYLLERKGTKRQIQSILQALISTSKALPPLDWDKAIGAVDRDIRSSLDDFVVRLALKTRSTNLLLKLTQRSSLLKLTLEAQAHLLENLDVLAEILPVHYLRRLLKLIPRLQESGKEDVLLAKSLKGIRTVLASESTSDKKRSISEMSRNALVNWCIDAFSSLKVDSYSDSRSPTVQRFIGTLVELKIEEIDGLIAAHQIDKGLLVFSLRISILLRRRGGGSISVEKLVRLLDVPSPNRPSALRMVVHELALAPVDKKERDDVFLNLMNSILLNFKRSDAKDELEQVIGATFDLLFASIAAWCRSKDPLYLLEEPTPSHQFGPDHDSHVVQEILFSNVASRFASFLCGDQRKLTDKVVDWAFQMIQMIKLLDESRAKFIVELLQCCRSSESYGQKVKDPRALESILQLRW